MIGWILIKGFSLKTPKFNTKKIEKMPNFKSEFVIRSLESKGASSPTKTTSNDGQLALIEAASKQAAAEDSRRERLKLKLNDVKRLASLSKAAYSRTSVEIHLSFLSSPLISLTDTSH